MAEYRLSPAAERDLAGIWKYTHREWGLEQADRYTDLLTAAFEVLAESPKSAPGCDHIRPGYRLFPTYFFRQCREKSDNNRVGPSLVRLNCAYVGVKRP